MERQTFKRLGYGFSALVMALSAVGFVPSGAARATDVSGDVAVADVETIVSDDATLDLTANTVLQGTVTLADGMALTINLGGFELSSTAATMFQVKAGATLTINGDGVINQGDGVITDSTSAGAIIINGGTFAKSTNAASRTLFNCATTNITINGGDFSDIDRTFGGYGITRGGASVTINGGKFGYQPEVSEDLGVYEVAEGVYEVAKLSVFTANNTTYTITTGTQISVGVATLGVMVNGAKWLPEVVVTNNENETVTNDVVNRAYGSSSNALKIKPLTSGKYNVAVMDKTGEVKNISVTAYDAMPAAKTYYRNLGETVVLDDILDEAWETTYSLAENDEANTTVTVDGNDVTIAAETVGEDVYTFAKTVDDSETPMTTTVKVVTYDLASNPVVEAGSAPINMNDYITLPEGYTATITAEGVDESAVVFAGAYATPVAVGERTFKYAITGNDEDLELKVYVKGAQTAIENRTLKVNEASEDLSTLYTPVLGGTLSISTEDEGATVDGYTVKFDTIGTKTVTFTEKAVDGTVLNSQDVEFEVYGIELPELEFFAGESVDFVPVTSEGVTILGVARSNSKLEINDIDGGYQFATSKAASGGYTATYTVEYADGTTESLTPQVIKAYRKVDYTDADLTIDLVDGSTDTDAKFTITGDGAFAITEVDAEGEAVEAEDQVLVADGENPAGVAGVYTFTTTATEVGTHYLKVTQTIGGLTSEETLEVTITDSSAEEAVELESVSAEIVDGAIVTTYNEGYEGEPVLAYAVEDDFAEIVTVTDGAIAVDEEFLTATDVDVVITVTATDGEIVKNATATYTIEANYTEVEADFEDDKDAIKPSETTKIVTKAVDGVVYTYDFYGAGIDIAEDGTIIDIAEDGTITVSDDYLSTVDTEVVITVNGFAGEGDDEVLLTSKTLTLTIAANYSYIDEEPAYEVTAGDGQTFMAGSDESLTIRIDAPYNQVTGIWIENQTLFDYLEELVENGATTEDAFATLTEQEQNSVSMWLTEGEDYTIAEGSTVITLTNSLLSRLAAGTYNMYVKYLDDTDIDNVIGSYAQASFIVEGGSTTVTPDTGAAVKGASSAAASIVTSVLGAITMAGAAIVTKFAKRR